ncbi:MAG: hypothetical protein H0X34_17675 [Chthoniobacterales bacterium]|nr:hypothetical protein [Chthoniobacterales bacterium]
MKKRKTNKRGHKSGRRDGPELGAAHGSAKQLSLVEALLYSGVREVNQEMSGGPTKTTYDGTLSYWEDAPREGRWHGKAWHPVEPILGGWRWDWVEVWVPASPSD